jgi:hypothetical protein
VDLDLDGVGAGDPTVGCDPALAPDDGDCEDEDPTVTPGASETCDGRDQDCDEKVDEADRPTWEDADGDGDGVGEPAYTACDEGRAEVGDDCDDVDPEVWPGATETPADGVDSDCDGWDGEPPTATG